MSNQREAIASILWTHDGGNGMAEYQAAAVIQYLWQRADDPEVVEAVLDAAEAANDLYPLDGEPNSVWEARYFSASFGAFLEQLIGPRPTEQEKANER